MLNLVVVSFQTVLAILVCLMKAGQTTAGMIVVIHVNDDNEFLAFLMGRESHRFITTTSVHADQTVLR